MDLFPANPDRQAINFLLVPGGGFRRLIAFDFASANMAMLGATNFSIASTQTLSVGRLLRTRQGFFRDSAFEMIDRISAVPASVIEGIFESMPAEWLTSEQKRGICEPWSNGMVGGRLEALRKGIGDDSLL